jgi:hypothetical protein
MWWVRVCAPVRASQRTSDGVATGGFEMWVARRLVLSAALMCTSSVIDGLLEVA